MLKYYCKLLEFLVKNKYTCLNFSMYHKYKNNLNNKIVLLRHDIHLRDVENAYKMIEIEKKILGKCLSTFFVQWDLCGFSNYEKEYEKKHQHLYEKFILYCIDNNIDVQPHISPIHYYASKFKPEWLNMSIFQIETIFKENYIHSTDCLNIEIIKKDILNIKHLIKEIEKYVEEYTKKWKKKFNITVEGYAAHGCSINLSRVIHNGIILNLDSIYKKSNIMYEVYSKNLRDTFNFYSDGSIPKWIFSPELIYHDKIIILCHPFVWNDNKTIFMNGNTDGLIKYESNEYKNIKYGLYPYLANIDIIINISDYLKSNKNINDYNEEYKNCIMIFE